MLFKKLKNFFFENKEFIDGNSSCSTRVNVIDLWKSEFQCHSIISLNPTDPKSEIAMDLNDYIIWLNDHPVFKGVGKRRIYKIQL